MSVKGVALPLLEPVSTIKLPAVAEFRAVDHFLVGGKAPGGIEIGFINDHFQAAFLEGDGKVENSIPPTSLRVSRLLRNSLDLPIIEALGGQQVVGVSLAHVWMMIEEYIRCLPTGIQHISGLWNVYYVLDNDSGQLMEVDTRWSVWQQWELRAFPLTFQEEWVEGVYVFSPLVP